MIKKISVILIMFLFIYFLVEVNVFGVETQEDKNDDYIWIEENVIEIEKNVRTNEIRIKNGVFNINSRFQSYTLSGSAICRNLLLFQCDDERIKHLSIDIEKDIMRFIIEYDAKRYCSKIKISEIIFINDDKLIKNSYQFIGSEKISCMYDFEKYKNLEESSYIAYICFDDLLNNSEKESYSLRDNTYTFTGGSVEAKEIGYEMINEIFDYSLLSTSGLHYGTVNSNNGIKYIYIVDSSLYIGNKYISKVKIWEVTFDYVNTIYSSLDVNVDLNIVKLYDAFIEGSATEGKITLAEEGYTYVPMKSISSIMSVDNYSYISKYKIGYTNEEVSYPSYINGINNLLGRFVPYYQKITSVVNKVNNLMDNENQISFDNYLSEFEFISNEDNLKEIGFLVTNSDVGSGIFNDEYLHNYSFYQDITITEVPNYLIDVNAEIQIVLLYEPNETLVFRSNIKVENNYNCNHTLIYESDNSNVHKVNCNHCMYSYYDEHDLEIITNGNKCFDCGYFENTIFSYVSNNDGKSHTLYSGSICKREFCMGAVGEDGYFYCIKCGQNVNGIGFNSIISHIKDDETK